MGWEVPPDAWITPVESARSVRKPARAIRNHPEHARTSRAGCAQGSPSLGSLRAAPAAPCNPALAPCPQREVGGRGRGTGPGLSPEGPSSGGALGHAPLAPRPAWLLPPSGSWGALSPVIAYAGCSPPSLILHRDGNGSDPFPFPRTGVRSTQPQCPGLPLGLPCRQLARPYFTVTVYLVKECCLLVHSQIKKETTPRFFVCLLVFRNLHCNIHLRHSSTLTIVQ